MKKTPLIVVAGPTASGKTSLSVQLAKRLDGEIVSADSMQIYKYMDIGTAKPTDTEKEGIPHHMMDFLDPSENFSVADYCSAAHEVIRDIHARGQIPIVVGGTGFYIDSLVNNIDFGETVSDGEIRKELELFAKERGREALYEILKKIDPITAEKYHPNNVRRIIRAIEFYRITGETISAHAMEEKDARYNAVWLAVDWDREVLYDRINRRVDQMVSDGLLDEAKSLLERYDPTSTAMQSIGYKELKGYFYGTCELSEALEQIKMSSRRYAKRQLTWFRRNEDIHWIKADENIADTAEKIVRERLAI